MTAQSPFMIVAEVEPAREAELRGTLAELTHAPGAADPGNALVPFGDLETLHFARFAVLKDETLEDITAYHEPRADYPTYLVFLGDVDGETGTFLARLAEQAQSGLTTIFSHCRDFSAGSDLAEWLQARNVAPATMYANYVGRTVRQVREEEALHQALQGFIAANAKPLQDMAPREAYEYLRDFAAGERQAGRLTLTPAAPAPVEWQLRNLVHLIGVPLLLLVASPLLLLYLPFFLVLLRYHEKTEPESAPRVDPAHADRLAALEDREITNQFTALGSIKPGLFRLTTITFLLWIIDYTTRHIYNHGRLARVSTIHFARWVFLDNRKRLLFASNYDGSLESYMDDFINKVGYGLNIVFSNGVGYPKTNWLFMDGCKDEQKFKNFLRRHQLPTEVWYNACPGLTVLDKRRNMLIREGLERPAMTEAEIQEWLDLF
jgi:hypothetical protein